MFLIVYVRFYGLQVVDLLVQYLEKESILHKRVDLFFLVDSVAQCSRGLKGTFSSKLFFILKEINSAYFTIKSLSVLEVVNGVG